MWLSDPRKPTLQPALSPTKWALHLLPAPAYLAHPRKGWAQGHCPRGADGRAPGAGAVVQSGLVPHHPHVGTRLEETLPQAQSPGTGAPAPVSWEGREGVNQSVRGSWIHSPQPCLTSSTAAIPSSAGSSHTLPLLHPGCHDDPARPSGPPDRKRRPALGPAVQPAQPPSPARTAALSAATAGAPRCPSTAEPRRPPLDRHLQLPLPKKHPRSDREPIGKGTLHPHLSLNQNADSA